MPWLGLFNYGAALFLILFGLYVMMTENNIIRKVVGMVVLQTGVILFYITLGYKWDSLLPIIPVQLEHGVIDASRYANPLPHALMLTAIVVGVSTLGMALTLIISIYRSAKSLEENEILKKASSES